MPIDMNVQLATGNRRMCWHKIVSILPNPFVMGRKEKNNHELESSENINRKRSVEKEEKDEKYVDENLNTTDSDAAEIDPRMRHASQSTGNTAEEGDEDYDDEEEG